MANVPSIGETAAPYLAQFAEIEASLPGAGAPWLGALRRDAIARFAETGLPTSRLEDWRFTDLRRMARTTFADAGTGSVGDLDWIAPWYLEGPCHRLVFANGRFAPELSEIGALPRGARLRPFADAVFGEPESLKSDLARISEAESGSLVDLNTAMTRDGLVLHLDPGVALDAPVHLIHVASAPDGAVAFHPRVLVVAEDGSRASVFETYLGAGDGSYWTNAVSEIIVGRDAHIAHHKLQQESTAGYHTGFNRVRVGQGGSYSGFVMSLGAQLARTEIRVALEGEHATCRIDGSVLLRGRQHGDVTTEIDHLMPNGQSRQTFKNVLDDRSRSVFQGRVLVEKDAQKTDAGQSNRNLLLSQGAEADSKPELRIFADDVKCSHGATVGELDKNSLFYLQSRGIPAEEARGLLIEGFVAELIEGVEQPAVAAQLRRALDGWLAAAREHARDAA
jgi:Fe-S cluster assembly protein SufD